MFILARPKIYTKEQEKKARKKSQKKWAKKNQSKIDYNRAKSATKKFVKEAKKEDIELVELWIDERKTIINSEGKDF